MTVMVTSLTLRVCGGDCESELTATEYVIVMSFQVVQTL